MNVIDLFPTGARWTWNVPTLTCSRRTDLLQVRSLRFLIVLAPRLIIAAAMGSPCRGMYATLKNDGAEKSESKILAFKNKAPAPKEGKDFDLPRA